MRRRPIVWAILALVGAFLVACETMTEQQRQQAMGAGVGGAIGAASCLLVGRCDTKDAAIRAAAGAAVGWVAVRITQARSEKRADASQEAAVLGYTPPQGTVVKLQNAAIDPTYCGAGEELHFSMEYTVLAPAETPTLPVAERWVILKEGSHRSRLITELMSATRGDGCPMRRSSCPADPSRDLRRQERDHGGFEV